MKDYIVFSLSANKKLASEVASSLKVPLGEVEVKHFADGEVLVKSLTDVKNKDVVIIQSTSDPSFDRLFELLLFINSLKNQNPKSISLFIPYFGYSRQEVPYNNEPNSFQVVCDILDTAGVDKILTFDLHNPDEEHLKTEFVNLHSAPLFIDYFKKVFEEEGLANKDLVIVAPDHGGNLRAHNVLNGFDGSQLIVLTKYRPEPNSAEHLQTSEDLTGKTCLIIDDIIDTGGTLISAAKLLHSRGAKEIFVAATHAVISNNPENKLFESGVKQIVVTNTIEKDLDEDIKVLDILPLILEQL